MALHLLNLPIYIIYRILDHLDELTILCSVFNVSTKLNNIINTYNRYEVKLVLYSTSKKQIIVSNRIMVKLAFYFCDLFLLVWHSCPWEEVYSQYFNSGATQIHKSLTNTSIYLMTCLRMLNMTVEPIKIRN